MKSEWSETAVMVNMERPRGARHVETLLSRTQRYNRWSDKPSNLHDQQFLKFPMLERVKGSFTSKSRSRSPDPGRKCPTLQPPAGT